MESKTNKNALKYAFFGKSSCLVLHDDTQNGTFLKVGKKVDNDSWSWQKAKMSLSELGEIISVLKDKMGQTSFIHSFNDRQQTRIWINRDDKKMIFFKINDCSKPINLGEQEVLLILLEQIIARRVRETDIENKKSMKKIPQPN